MSRVVQLLSYDNSNNDTATMSDSDYIALHVCPVCKKERNATLDPRKAVREHIRRLSKTSAAHKMWYDLHFATHFKHGGLKIPVPETTEKDVIDAIKSSFGEDWASRVQIST